MGGRGRGRGQGGGGKRRGDGGGGGGKRHKPSSGGGGNGPAIPHDKEGILVTCDGHKEWQASRQAMDVLQEYWDRLAPAKEAAADVKAGDISNALEAELAELKKEDNKKDRRFWYHETGVAGMLYITVKYDTEAGEPTPTQLADAIATDVAVTKAAKTRFCLRFMPVQGACFSGLEEMKALAAKLVPPAFEGLKDPIKYAIHYEHRASPKMNRLDVINAFVDQVPKDPAHTVDLTNPDKIIMVQVLRNACAVGITENFYKYKKYNLRELAKEDEEGNDAEAKPSEAKAKVVEGKAKSAEEEAKPAKVGTKPAEVGAEQKEAEAVPAEAEEKAAEDTGEQAKEGKATEKDA